MGLGARIGDANAGLGPGTPSQEVKEGLPYGGKALQLPLLGIRDFDKGYTNDSKPVMGHMPKRGQHGVPLGLV